MSRPNETVLEEYLAARSRRLDFERQARSQGEAEAKFQKELEVYVREQTDGSDRKTVRLHGHTLGFKEGQKRPAWKTEYVAACGSDAAQQVIDRTPASEQFFVIEG